MLLLCVVGYCVFVVVLVWCDVGCVCDCCVCCIVV